ncbi:MAG: hypothetical protein COV36_03315 [Alphaproteobacteria bacterium CG11_big_fil_rev_8_21_14_0_20_44_7]|nr:MAG: hypothetical protein COV36_03315 [Alphaproteobacteria bacterium CG11_big_fil_rev_8_21_14_0_20_44_7]
MKLSQKRAEAVQDYLTSKGYINTSIAQTSWLGEAAPKVECDGNKVTNGLINCLAENRRVEVQVEFIQ